MNRVLLTSITVLSLAAALPAGAQQRNPSSPPPGAQQSEAVPQASQDEMMQAQQALNQKGFNAGDADGILGPQTRRALMSFQRKQGLQPSGELDEDTMAALGLPQGASPSSTTGQGQRPSPAPASPGPGDRSGPSMQRQPQ